MTFTGQFPLTRRAFGLGALSSVVLGSLVGAARGSETAAGALRVHRFERALAAADWRDPGQAESEVIAAMQDYLPSEDLLFFLQISIAPNAQRLGLI